MKKDRGFWKEEYAKQYQENNILKEELEKLRKKTNKSFQSGESNHIIKNRS
ncbi:hypothetical protein M1D52_21960 [Olivibacter sp. SA151]|uniref:hypothetical protein n=1 Tax=Olivibacter jilunii TaxID=985016 RepID=UPI003F18C802